MGLVDDDGDRFPGRINGGSKVSTYRKQVRADFKISSSALCLHVLSNISEVKWKIGIETSTSKSVPGDIITNLRRKLRCV